MAKQSKRAGATAPARSQARAGTGRKRVRRSQRTREMGRMREPKSPMPEQHQQKPGLESKMKPRPRYQARNYKGADKLAGKVALISGGDSGIGRAVAVLFAREGADVAIIYLAQEQSDAEETQRAVKKEGQQALLIPGDVRDPEFCSHAVEQTLATFDKLDLLVNNA